MHIGINFEVISLVIYSLVIYKWINQWSTNQGQMSALSGSKMSQNYNYKSKGQSTYALLPRLKSTGRLGVGTRYVRQWTLVRGIFEQK